MYLKHNYFGKYAVWIVKFTTVAEDESDSTSLTQMGMSINDVTQF